MSDTYIHVVGDDGNTIPVDSLAVTYSYNADSTLATETIVHDSITYVKSYTYSSGKLVGVSRWEAQ